MPAAPIDGWEERFDEKFPGATSIETKENGTWSLNYDGHEIKSWFRNLRASERAEIQKELNVFTKPGQSPLDFVEDGIQAERARLRDAVMELKFKNPTPNGEFYNSALDAVLQFLSGEGEINK